MRVLRIDNYIIETPLYEITWKKENRFAFNDAEKDTVLEELRGMAFVNVGLVIFSVLLYIL